MAPGLDSGRRGRLNEHTFSAPLDFDPEADSGVPSSDDSEDDLDNHRYEDSARQHYASVGKSKLHQPKTAALGPQYRGSRVSRDAVSDDDEEDDDPFLKGFGDEDSDEEGSEANGLNGDMGSLEEGADKGDDDEDLDDQSDVGSDDDGGRHFQPNNLNRPTSDGNRGALLHSVAKDSKTAASPLAYSMKTDAEKGRAVKKQRTTFDALLNTRIKLQKSLIGANTIVGMPSNDLDAQRQEASAAISAAETAAFKFWSSLNGLREDIIASRTGEKRKRSFTSKTPMDQLWTHMQSQEEANLPHRNVILQRWSRKTQEASAGRTEGSLIDKSGRQSTIIDTLQEHLSNRSRLIARTRTPRSCAPLQLANKVTSDDKIYDDADFYSLLLKELLEQKSADSVAASNIDINSLNIQREAKTKKNIDTKASKGRKLRYTVHEKLQNFVAPEDRRTWGERQSDELFGSLFGRRMGLGEEVEGDLEMGSVVEDGDDGAGLMMFRS